MSSWYEVPTDWKYQSALKDPATTRVFAHDADGDSPVEITASVSLVDASEISYSLGSNFGGLKYADEMSLSFTDENDFFDPDTGSVNESSLGMWVRVEISLDPPDSESKTYKTIYVGRLKAVTRAGDFSVKLECGCWLEEMLKISPPYKLALTPYNHVTPVPTHATGEKNIRATSNMVGF